MVEKSGKELSLPYRALAQLLNCSEEEIAIVSSATEAWQQIVYGLAWNWNPGDVVLTTVAEYGANRTLYVDEEETMQDSRGMMLAVQCV